MRRGCDCTRWCGPAAELSVQRQPAWQPCHGKIGVKECTGALVIERTSMRHPCREAENGGGEPLPGTLLHMLLWSKPIISCTTNVRQPNRSRTNHPPTPKGKRGGLFLLKLSFPLEAQQWLVGASNNTRVENGGGGHCPERCSICCYGASQSFGWWASNTIIRNLLLERLSR